MTPHDTLECLCPIHTQGMLQLISIFLRQFFKSLGCDSSLHVVVQNTTPISTCSYNSQCTLYHAHTLKLLFQLSICSLMRHVSVFHTHDP